MKEKIRKIDWVVLYLATDIRSPSATKKSATGNSLKISSIKPP
jgi:hypothetical protein